MQTKIVKKSDRLIIILVIIAVIFSLFLYSKGKEKAEFDYPNKLFDDSYVHTIDLRIDDVRSFFENSQEEEYILADVIIDNESFKNVGLRTKGNNSLHLINEYDLYRYSFKIEFDHFQKGNSYHGLDKLSLDAFFQDNSYLKTKLTYEMFEMMGVPSPLSSYAQIKINGQDWGLYLAIEEIEDSFLARNFGYDHGKLYKPDYANIADANLDIGLNYLGDDPDLYPGIFNNARTSISEADKKRLINVLKEYNDGNFKRLNLEMILKYFCVQIFCLNWDSYIGHTGHNYFLYEDNGIVALLPWDYNLAYGTYAFGMSEPIRDTTYLLNFPIDTPAFKEIMFKRPLYHRLMQDDENFKLYHKYFDQLLNNFFKNGQYELFFEKYTSLIDPYVENDPTAFCSFEDYKLAVRTLKRWVEIRSESIDKQLKGEYPSTIKEMNENEDLKIKADIDIRDLGDFDDLKECQKRQSAVFQKLCAK